MAKCHPFNFAGGEELSHMGATWFVSYAYFVNIDRAHINWQNVKTASNRQSIYKRTVYFHEFWLLQILKMENSRLNTNTLGLNAENVKLMATKILLKMKE